MSDLNFLKSLGKVNAPKPVATEPANPGQASVAPAAPAKPTLPGLKLRLGTAASTQGRQVQETGQALAVAQTTVVAESSADGLPSASVPATTEAAKGPAGFKTLLDSFDKLVGESLSISALDLDNARNYVASVMTELKTNPEMQSFVIDRDVHNIMKYVQASANIAGMNFVTKASARAKKESKAAAAANVSLEMFDDSIDVAAQMAALKAKRLGGKSASTPLSIQDLSSINTDDIAPKDRK